MKKVGIIGCGNMGGAIIKGILAAQVIEKEGLFVYDRNDEKAKVLQESLGFNISPKIDDLINEVDIVLLAVKPNIGKELIKELDINKDKLVISIMAGVNIDTLESGLGKDKKIVRAMPNTPALVLEGMSAISFNKNVLDEEKDIVKNIFNSFGLCEVVDESLMDIVTGVSGSSPAYVFMMIEAMADSAVRGGMTRDKAYVFAAQAVMGSAKMVLETKLHPGVLKDMVTSPKGTTIEAVEVLERRGFRSSLIEAIDKATNKSIELGKNK